MRMHFRTIKFLAAMMGTSSAFLPLIPIGMGIVVGSATTVLAQQPVMIPLEHVKDERGETVNRLGIWVGINNGKRQRYLFDTGSDQFNTQIGSEVKGVRPIGSPRLYAYGDSTYGYKYQKVSFGSITYFDTKDSSISIDLPLLGGNYQAGKIVDYVYTRDSAYGTDKRLSPYPVYEENGQKYHADLDAREKMQNGEPADEGGRFAGTFGAGDFLGVGSANSSAFGGATKSGYIVSANANLDDSATPGCAPCSIVNLDASLRAQFTTIIPWNAQHDKHYRPTFPGSDANASSQNEGNYTFQFTVKGTAEPILWTGPVLLDTGTSEAVLVDSKDLRAELKNAGVVFKDGRAEIEKVTITGKDGQAVDIEQADLLYLDEDSDDPLTVGIPFFYNNSVVYDLENKATGYTPYFVSANNFTTSSSNADELKLSRITAQMGNQGWLGIAGVISGSGDLTLDSKTVVRLTNANNYTGATNINRDAFLYLAGPGSIEHSSKVVADGTLDIFEHGNFNPIWGVPNSQNDASIRSLSGNGTVTLGDRTLVLTAANDTFGGVINDLDEQNKHRGGSLFVAGGVQTLSGKNDYSGMTTVGPGASLLLAKSGSIAHDVTTSGFLGNDGQINGVALAGSGGVIAGTGSYGGAVTIGDDGAVAPGSALEPGKAVATLTVKGDFTQQAGSIYQAGLASSADRINVSGSAAIDSGAHIELLNQGMTLVDKRYILVTAAGGVNGTYGSLTGTLHTDSPFVDFELAYDPTNVYLDSYRTATAFADVGNTFNQHSMGAASEALGAVNPIHDGILFLTTQESRDAFDLLSGEIHASVHSALIQDSHFVRDAANDRIRAAFEGVGAASVPVMAYGPDGAESVAATTDKYAVWGHAFGAWGHLDGDGNAARLDSSTGGFLAGGDTAVGETWRVGLLAGYSRASFDVDNRASTGSGDNYHLGIYAGTKHGNIGFRSGLAYTWHRIETDRSVVFSGFGDSLSADYDAGTFQAFGELGYRFDTASAAFEPYVNLAYVNFDADGFTEEGGLAALSSGDRSSDTTFTTLGLRASTELMFGTINATARGGIGWRHAFGDIRPETGLAFAGGSSFAIEGVPIARNAALLEAGLEAKVAKNATLGVTYQGQIASDAQEHGFNAKLAVRF